MAHLGEVEAHQEEFRAAGTNLLVVSQAEPDVLASFLHRYPKPYPVVGDPGRKAYRAFGLEQTNWRTFLRPDVISGYLRGILGGTRVRTPYRGEDVLQLGGDFILDRAGRVEFAHPSHTPTDRPAIATLLAAVGASGR